MPIATVAIPAEEHARLREQLSARVMSAAQTAAWLDAEEAEQAALGRDGQWLPPSPQDDEEWLAADLGADLADDEDDWLGGPGGGPPGDEGTWLAALPGELQDEYFEATREPELPNPIKAGFWNRRRDNDGFGFAAGGVGDEIPPGPVLAGLAGDVWQDGLSRRSDDELVGIMRAGRRLASWAAAMELAATGELVARRFAEEDAGDAGVGEHVTDEVAAALTLTGRAADRLVNLAVDLSGLPATATALAAGEIDLPRAWVVAEETSPLNPAQRATVEQQVLARAGGQTTTLLRRSVKRAALKVAPDAAKDRKEQAQREARVECWEEPAGTSALAGRDLPGTEVLAADRNLTDLAKQLKAAGVTGNLDQLRAAVYLALLSGKPFETLLPAAPAPQRDGQENGLEDHQDSRSTSNPAPTLSAAGSVHLTMPLATWLGLTDTPGDVAGYGPVDAMDARSLAAMLASRDDCQWCLTLTDRNGHAVAHGCARPRRPRRTRAGPRGTPTDGTPADQAWTFTITFLQTGSCDHSRESSGYEPPPHLRHLIQVRHAACTFPGCRHSAARCDVDHTLAYQRGGRTCECNLAPLCRRHHRAKQAHGWQLTQDEPGILTWITPSGRTYVTQPTAYEA
ncbi:MAG TPA: HNH endonuclease signature motif containing protein [Streptosporangiaceae bacterium]|nr:HNH endonuclease signature motif containing protein [Streptosporangiaceae bacterium]